MVCDALLKLTSHEALTRLDAHSVPCGPVHHPVNRVLDDQQLRSNSTIFETIHPSEGKMRFAQPAARFEKSQFQVRHHAPRVGEHSISILQEVLSMSPEESRGLQAR